MIELARLLLDAQLQRTVRLVAFTNEEEPFFQTRWMGSYQYAMHHSRDSIKAMLSLETMGYYTDEPWSQRLTGWRHVDAMLLRLVSVPQPGNYIAFVADTASRPFGLHVLRRFRTSATVPSALLVGPRWMRGVGWSDHWSYWQLANSRREVIPAIMVTDTARMRNPCYHRSCDRADREGYLRYDMLADIVIALSDVATALADPDSWP